MRNFLNDLKYKLQAFMYGRYGNDELNNFLSILFVLFWLLSVFTGKRWFYAIGLVCLGLYCFRAFSKDCPRRSKERLQFLKIVDKIKRFPKQLKTRWNQRKTHKFYRCKNCGVTIRVPKGLGDVEITCPKCKNKFVDRT